MVKVTFLTEIVFSSMKRTLSSFLFIQLVQINDYIKIEKSIGSWKTWKALLSFSLPHAPLLKDEI